MRTTRLAPGRLTLTAILGGAVAVRTLVCFATAATWFNTDSLTYLSMAEAIRQGEPFSALPNGYPLLIAAVQSLVGSTATPATLILLNIAASSLVVLLGFQIVEGIGATRQALVAAALLAVWPTQLNYVRQLMSEVPATALLVAGAWLILRGRAFFAGVCWYFAAMMRTSLLPALPLALIWFLFAGRSRRNAGAFALAAGLCFVAEIGLGHYGVVSAPRNIGPNLLIAIHSASPEDIRYSADALSPAEQAAPVRAYLAYAVEQPLAFMQQRARSLWELWGPWPSAGDANAPRSALRRAIIGLRFPLLLLALGAVAFASRRSTPWLLLIPIAAVTLVHVAFFSTPRFSYPAEPFALMLASLVSWPLAVKRASSA